MGCIEMAGVEACGYGQLPINRNMGCIEIYYCIIHAIVNFARLIETWDVLKLLGDEFSVQLNSD